MPPGSLEAAVKLASAGLSLACILAIVWTGYLLRRLPEGADKTTRALLKTYMVLCGGLAILGAVLSLMGVAYNAEAFREKQQRIAQLEDEFPKKLEKSLSQSRNDVAAANSRAAQDREKFQKLEGRIAELRGAAKAAIDSKTVYDMKYSGDPLAKEAIVRLESVLSKTSKPIE